MSHDPPPELRVGDLTLSFGGVTALDRVSLTVAPGEICGLIGPNGAGKTTLFNCVTRLYRPDSGTIAFAGHDLLRTRPDRIVRLGIARTFQNLALFPSLTVLENTLLGAHSRDGSGFTASLLGLPATRSAHRRLTTEAREILADLGLSDVADQPAAGLPFGTLKRVELARALAGHPRLLLLDEPAGGLTHAEVDELGELILRLRAERGLGALLVEHHMGLVMGISDHVVAMESGREIADGTPEDVRADERVLAAYLGRTA
ncbi:branched-chain amino acid transport system ATP-binding protein [Actinocorallia herbida]|uniref:Branched-chain amino acid transport system ATP-binding protein n=1 Tax=Actinocorallia herbida TaxID=58109 RepID=A0A3N1CYU9_9ACTN|nr:ABC transporter ATP-binding protein [Actinocorallia herbida]ROO86461.1 branched-chain amino acid transport system ATP-binding protein [Actinocorallia herbida]